MPSGLLSFQDESVREAVLEHDGLRPAIVDCDILDDTHNERAQDLPRHRCRQPLVVDIGSAFELLCKNELGSTMYEFLCQFDVMLQSLTNWLSYAAIIVAFALALCQIAYYIARHK